MNSASSPTSLVRPLRRARSPKTVAMILARSASSAALAEDFAAAHGLVHLEFFTNSGSTSWYGFASAIVAGLKARGQPVRASAVHAITAKDFPTKADTPGQFAARSVAPTPGVRRHYICRGSRHFERELRYSRSARLGRQGATGPSCTVPSIEMVTCGVASGRTPQSMA